MRYRALVVCLVAGISCGCSLFKVAKELSHAEEAKKPSPPEQAIAPSYEGPLLDNKVTALRIKDELKKAGAEFSQVEVTGGEHGVTLTGKVRSAADKAKAEEIARKVKRKMKLTNELQVGP